MNDLNTYLTIDLENYVLENIDNNLDLWLISRLNNVKKSILKAYDNYLYFKIPNILE